MIRTNVVRVHKTTSKVDISSYRYGVVRSIFAIEQQAFIVLMSFF